MSMLTHWNPAKALARFDPTADLDDVLRGFGLRPWRDADVAPTIRLDVSEDENNYRVKAEIPGVEKEDIELAIDGNQVSISAEVKHESKKSQGETELYSERSYGKSRRVFSLPVDVDGSKAEARYEKGVLAVTLPKKQNGQSRRVSIS